MSNLTIGQHMKKCRKEHGLTQKELAEKAKIAKTALGAYERDLVAPGLFNLITLADVLGVSVDEYIGREDQGCEYCNGSEKCFPVDSDIPYPSYDYIEFYDKKALLRDADGCDIRINYCPMCGRKLGGAE